MSCSSPAAVTTHPVRELTMLALAVAKVLDSEPDKDRRDRLHDHFLTVLDEELRASALSRALIAPADAITEALSRIWERTLARGPADFRCGGVR